MKRVNFFLIAAFVAASSMLFVSCGDEETEEDNPSIAVKATYGSKSKTPLIDGAVIDDAVQGTMIVLDIEFTMGASKLTKARMTSKIGVNPTVTVLDSVLNEGLLNLGSKEPIKFRFDTNVGFEDEELNFEATDKKGRVTPFSVTIKEKEVDINFGDKERVFVLSEATIELGGQTHKTLPSFYSVSEGKTYNVRGAQGAAARIDFAYSYDKPSGAKATISSPLAISAIFEYTTSADIQWSKWSKKNNTKFYVVEASLGLTATPSDIYGAENWWDESMDIVNNPEHEKTLSQATDLKANNVLVFKTEGGIKGAFVVTTTGTAADGSIKFRMIEMYEKE